MTSDLLPPRTSLLTLCNIKHPSNSAGIANAVQARGRDSLGTWSTKQQGQVNVRTFFGGGARAMKMELAFTQAGRIVKRITQSAGGFELRGALH